MTASDLFEISAKAVNDKFGASEDQANAIILGAKEKAENGEFKHSMRLRIEPEVVSILERKGFTVTTSEGTTYGAITTIEWSNAQKRF
jgi:hypothetical protein